MIKAIIFDWDGTLYSSNFFENFNTFNKKVTNELAGKFKLIYDVYFKINKPKLVPQAVETIKRLKKDHVIILYSNTRHYRIEKELKYLGLENLFDYVFDGSKDLVYKPDPHLIFELLYKLMIKKDEVIVVGNNLDDYNLAKNIGARICISHEVTKYTFPNVDFYINKITELPNIVDIYA